MSRMVMIHGHKSDPEKVLKEEPVTVQEAEVYNRMMDAIGKSYVPLYAGQKVIKLPFRGDK